MKRNAILGITVLALTCYAQAQTDDSGKCTAATLNRAYGVSTQWNRPSAFRGPG
jgi:hypothetical protein